MNLFLLSELTNLFFTCRLTVGLNLLLYSNRHRNQCIPKEIPAKRDMPHKRHAPYLFSYDLLDQIRLLKVALS